MLRKAMSPHRPWRTIIGSTFRETLRDDAEGLAAQLSYYFFLSLFPMLLALVAFASLFSLRNFADAITRYLSPIAPGQVLDVIRDQMIAISKHPPKGVLTIGLATAIWSASAAMGAVVNAMNRARGVDEARSWWKVRLVSILLTLGLALFVLVSIALVLAGPQAADLLTRWFGLSAVFSWGWKILQWPLAFALVATGIGLIYHFAPSGNRPWRWYTPGSILATSLWLLGSLGFRLYVTNVNTYEGTYGTLGGIIVVLLWFYVSGLAIVIGAELDAEIERPPDRPRKRAAA
jgi:membrane protein